VLGLPTHQPLLYDFVGFETVIARLVGDTELVKQACDGHDVERAVVAYEHLCHILVLAMILFVDKKNI